MRVVLSTSLLFIFIVSSQAFAQSKSRNKKVIYLAADRGSVDGDYAYWDREISAFNKAFSYGDHQMRFIFKGPFHLDPKTNEVVAHSRFEIKEKHVELVNGKPREKSYTQSLLLTNNLMAHKDEDLQDVIKQELVKQLKEAKKENRPVLLYISGHGHNNKINGKYHPELACIAIKQARRPKNIEPSTWSESDRKGFCLTYKEMLKVVKDGGYGSSDSPPLQMIAGSCYGGGVGHITNNSLNTCFGSFTSYKREESTSARNHDNMLKMISESDKSNRPSMMEAVTGIYAYNGSYNSGGGLSSDFYVRSKMGTLEDENLDDVQPGYEKWQYILKTLNLDDETDSYACSAIIDSSFEALNVKELDTILKTVFADDYKYASYLPKNVRKKYLDSVNKISSIVNQKDIFKKHVDNFKRLKSEFAKKRSAYLSKKISSSQLFLYRQKFNQELEKTKKPLIEMLRNYDNVARLNMHVKFLKKYQNDQATMKMYMDKLKCESLAL